MRSNKEAAGPTNIDLHFNLRYKVGKAKHAVHRHQNDKFIEKFHSVLKCSLKWRYKSKNHKLSAEAQTDCKNLHYEMVLCDYYDDE